MVAEEALDVPELLVLRNTIEVFTHRTNVLEIEAVRNHLLSPAT